MKQLILILLMVSVLVGCQSAGDVSPRDKPHLEESVQFAASLSTTDTINLAESVELVVQRRSEQ